MDNLRASAAHALTPARVTAGFICLGTAFIAACMYYDYVRHRDPDFLRKLRSSRRRQTASHRHDGDMRRQMKLVPKSQAQLAALLPRKYEDLLLNEMCIAEQYMKQQNMEQALIHFATAIAMAHDPTPIIGALRRSLPPLMYNDLACILNKHYDNKFEFMYDDMPLLGKVHMPAPQHSVLF